MKKSFLVILLVFIVVVFYTAYAKNCESSESSQHFNEQNIIALNLEDLEINKDGIFLNLNGEWIQLKTIIQDDNGNFIGINNKDYWIWKCSKCDAKNEFFRKRCKVCGYKPV